MAPSTAQQPGHWVEAAVEEMRPGSTTRALLSQYFHHGFHLGSSGLLAPRSRLAARADRLGPGPIAGIVVGCVVFVFAVAVCGYPLVVRFSRRRKREIRASDSDDSATELPNLHPGLGAPVPVVGGVAHEQAGRHREEGTRRLSAEASSFPQAPQRVIPAPTPLRQMSKEVSLGDDESIQRGFGDQDGFAFGYGDGQQYGGQTAYQQGGYAGQSWQYPQQQVEEHMPQASMQLMPNEYLTSQGQNRSYYDTAVTSEALGMTTPPADNQPAELDRKRAGSRGSIRSIMNMMRTGSKRDTTRSSTGSTITPGPQSPHSVIYSQQGQGQELSQSPTVMASPPALESMAPPPRPAMAASPIAVAFSSMAATPAMPLVPAAAAGRAGASPSPPAEQADDARRSPRTPHPPPSQPFPGTVNPMDIMKPSNDQENLWQFDHPQPESHFVPPEAKVSLGQTATDGGAAAASAPGIGDAFPVKTEHNLPPVEHVAMAQQPTQTYNPQNGTAASHSNIASYPADQSGLALKPSQQPAYSPSLDNPHTPIPHQDEPSVQVKTETSPVPEILYNTEAPTAQLDPNPRRHGHRKSAGSDISFLSDISGSPYPFSAAAQSAQGTPATSGFSPGSHGSPPDMRQNGSPEASPRTYTCEKCAREFDQSHKLNHHMRYHDRPHECQQCDKKFGTKTHLERHINDKHNKTKKYFCTEQTCPYSRQGGRSFPRKDNWRRHMQNIHSITPTHDPEPEVLDQQMGGM